MTTWIGWIEARPEDVVRLKELGVEIDESYNYNEEQGAVQGCSATDEVMERLIEEWPSFWPGAFTGIDENGEILPKEAQKYWEWEPGE